MEEPCRSAKGCYAARAPTGGRRPTGRNLSDSKPDIAAPYWDERLQIPHSGQAPAVLSVVRRMIDNPRLSFKLRIAVKGMIPGLVVTARWVRSRMSHCNDHR